MKLLIAIAALVLLATAPLVVVFTGEEPPTAAEPARAAARPTGLVRSYRETTPGERAAHRAELRRRMLPRISAPESDAAPENVLLGGAEFAEDVRALGLLATDPDDAL